MKQDWLTIEENENVGCILTKCAEEAEGEIVIPEGVTRMNEDAFEGCNKITSLVIPEGLSWIWDNPNGSGKGFMCPSLATIHFPSNIIEMESTVLKNTLWYENQPNGVVYAGVNVIGYKGEMPENSEIVIKEGAKYIANDAFKGCGNIVKVTLPDSLVQIGRDAFFNCKSLSTIHFPNVKEVLGGVLNNTLWMDSQPEGVVYAGATALGYKGEMPEDAEIVIKEGTRYIATYAFNEKNNLKKVSLPQSLVYIGAEAFCNCRHLEEIILPSSMVGIGSYAFCGCNNLVEVDGGLVDDYETDKNEDLSDVNGYIEIGAFWECKKLEFVFIPSAVKTIGECAFRNCEQLKTLYFPRTSSLKAVDVERWFGKETGIPQMVFEGGFPKANRLFAGLHIGRLCVNDKSVFKCFPKTNQTFEDCYIQELRINLTKKNCDRIPEDILSSLHLDSRNYAGRIIYAAPELCEEASSVLGYIRVTKALIPVPLEEGYEHDGDVFDINTKYIVSVEPIEIERYHPVKGSRIRCASNAYERGVDFVVYEPREMVMEKIDVSLRMLSEQVGGVAGLLNQLETLLMPNPAKIVL